MVGRGLLCYRLADAETPSLIPKAWSREGLPIYMRSKEIEDDEDRTRAGWCLRFRDSMELAFRMNFSFFLFLPELTKEKRKNCPRSGPIEFRRNRGDTVQMGPRRPRVRRRQLITRSQPLESCNLMLHLMLHVPTFLQSASTANVSADSSSGSALVV